MAKRRSFTKRRRRSKLHLKVSFRSLLNNRRFRWTFSIFLGFLAFFGTYFGIKYLLTDDNFQLSEIEIHASHQEVQDELAKELNGYLGKNIFGIRPSNIQKTLKGSSVYIKDVFVEKRLPNKLIVTVVERDAAIIILDLHGAYIVDEDGTILVSLDNFEPIEFSEKDTDVLRGYLDLRETSALTDNLETDNQFAVAEDIKTEEERAQEALDKLLEEKEKQEEIRIKLETRLHILWNRVIANNPDFFKYPIFYSYENKNFIIGGNFDLNIVAGSLEMLNQDWKYFTVKEYLWESPMRLKITTETGMEIFFFQDTMSEVASLRTVDRQISDLNNILQDAQLYGIRYKSIDLSTDKVLVTRLD